MGLLPPQPHSMGHFPRCSHRGTAGHLWAPRGTAGHAAPTPAMPSLCPPPHGQVPRGQLVVVYANALLQEKGFLGRLGEPGRGAWQLFPKPGLLFCCCGEKIGHQSAFEGELIQIYWWPGLLGRGI